MSTELDLVMEEDGRIIGHVMFSKAEIILDERLRVGRQCSRIETNFPS
jgi:predicted N-acetyltransferase YhbS